MSLASYSSFVLLFILHVLTGYSFDYAYICKDIYMVYNTRKTSQMRHYGLIYLHIRHSLQAQIYVLIRNSLNMDFLNLQIFFFFSYRRR